MIKRVLIVFTFLLIINVGCKSPTESKSNHNPPSDHTINKDGVKHKSGLSKPLENCVSCYGQDLRGGSSGVSCFECHGKKW